MCNRLEDQLKQIVIVNDLRLKDIEGFRNLESEEWLMFHWVIHDNKWVDHIMVAICPWNLMEVNNVIDVDDIIA